MSKPFNDVFGSTFIGEFVEILSRQHTPKDVPILIQAYLLDIDEHFYYLGENPIEITSAFPKEYLGLISIIQEMDPHTEYLNSLPIPTNEEEQN